MSVQFNNTSIEINRDEKQAEALTLLCSIVSATERGFTVLQDILDKLGKDAFATYGLYIEVPKFQTPEWSNPQEEEEDSPDQP